MARHPRSPLVSRLEQLNTLRYLQPMGKYIDSSTLGIENIAFGLPNSVVSSDEVVTKHGFDPDFVFGKLGIETRHILRNGESLSSLCVMAVRNLISDSNLDSSDIELLVLVSQTGDLAIPHMSAVLQAECGLPEDALVFDVSLGCSGYVAGIDIALALMERLGLARGVLVTADQYSRIVDEGDRATAPLFGDGASATLLSNEARWIPGKPDFGTVGEMSRSLLWKGDLEDHLFMDGRKILGFTKKHVSKSVLNVLRLNGLQASDVDYFVFHQANAFVLSQLESELSLPSEKIVRDYRDIGNTTSSSIPIALKRKVLTKGSVGAVLISGFGVGLSWHSNILFPRQTY